MSNVIPGPGVLPPYAPTARVFLPEPVFVTICADPPWPYRSPRAVVGNAGRGAQGGRVATVRQVSVDDNYDTMSVGDICDLPLGRQHAENAHLYLWTTNSHLLDGSAARVATAWGFTPKTVITWIKHRKGEPTAPSRKTGYWFRSATEHVVFAVAGKLRLRTRSAEATWFPHERLPHSVKPAVFYDNVRRWSPGPYLEMFARGAPRAGWWVWGNEVETDERPGRKSAAADPRPGPESARTKVADESDEPGCPFVREDEGGDPR